jgi:hypothetical protein
MVKGNYAAPYSTWWKDFIKRAFNNRWDDKLADIIYKRYPTLLLKHLNNATAHIMRSMRDQFGYSDTLAEQLEGVQMLVKILNQQAVLDYATSQSTVITKLSNLYNTFDTIVFHKLLEGASGVEIPRIDNFADYHPAIKEIIFTVVIVSLHEFKKLLAQKPDPTDIEQRIITEVKNVFVGWEDRPEAVVLRALKKQPSHSAGPAPTKRSPEQEPPSSAKHPKTEQNISPS